MYEGGMLRKYKIVRENILSKGQGIFNFLRLPELKVVKTCGFIVSVLF